MEMYQREQLTKVAIKDCLVFIRDEMNFQDKQKFMLRFKYVLSTVARGSWGGFNKDPHIKIGLADNCNWDGMTTINYWRDRSCPAQRVWKNVWESAQNDEWMYAEYAHIHFDSEIGGFTHYDPNAHITALVAHEIAHAIHWWLIKTQGELDRRAHGKKWQSIYRELRVNWVNPLLIKLGETKMAASKKKATSKKKSSKKKSSKKKAKQVSGAVQKVRDICNKMAKDITDGTKKRSDVIAACVDAGINKGTAATQYQKWKVETYA